MTRTEIACRLDHLTVTAPDLQAGCDWVERQLGVRLSPGGRHPDMGTHNRLLKLGSASFLEVITVDPDAPRPTRPRWFELDRLTPHDAPRLAAWVARADDLGAALDASTEPPGPALALRRGELRWRLTVPADGSLPMGGCAPALIQWDTPDHPAAGLADVGCRLRALELSHPQPERLRALLDALRLHEPGVDVTVLAAAVPGRVARIETPSGLRSLSG